MGVNPNPNEPNYPYGGGTDNPGDDTSIAGGPSNVAATETAPLFPENIGEHHAAIPPTLPQAQSDTVLPHGVQAIPPSGESIESGADYGMEDSADTGGVTVDPTTHHVRVAGQDEVQGETETTSGIDPSAFPEPNP